MRTDNRLCDALDELGRSLFASQRVGDVAEALCLLAATCAALRASAEDYALWKQICRERFNSPWASPKFPQINH